MQLDYLYEIELRKIIVCHNQKNEYKQFITNNGLDDSKDSLIDFINNYIIIVDHYQLMQDIKNITVYNENWLEEEKKCLIS